MPRNWFSPRLLWPVVALALSFSACSTDATAPGPQNAPVRDSWVASFTKLVPGIDGNGSSTAVVDSAGGVITLDGHVLYVPPGAVTGPTQFEMTLVQDQFIAVDLTATSVGSAVPNDVGAAGFLAPVFLRLSYSKATLFHLETLTIVWLRDDGQLVTVPSAVHPNNKSILAALEHFSAYAVAD